VTGPTRARAWNGTPDIGNQDHQRIKAALEARRAGAPSASGALETAAVSQGV
jgi:hypothetical protein